MTALNESTVPGTPDTPPIAALSAAEAKRATLRAQLAKGQERMAEMRAAGWKPAHRNPVEQAQAKPTSLKLAIKAHCWTCVGADADPGAKFRVRDCAVGPKCSLFAHRPWQNAKGGIQLNAEGVLEGDAGTEDTSED